MANYKVYSADSLHEVWAVHGSLWTTRLLETGMLCFLEEDVESANILYAFSPGHWAFFERIDTPADRG